MSKQPAFVDNQELTLAEAINLYVPELAEKFAEPPDLDVTTGYFNPRGYFAIQNALEQVGDVRILLGATPPDEDRERWRQPEDPRGEKYDQNRVDAALESLDEDIRRDRNLLGFSREVDKSLQRLIDWLNSDSVEVRRYEEGFIHGKAYIFPDEPGVIAGSSNFTGGGFTSNLELNLGHYQPAVTGPVENWFQDLWQQSEAFDLAQVYEERFEHFAPYLIYLRVLLERYEDELELEREARDGTISLASFQQDGVFRAKRFLEQNNGVIIADEVGLGKTYLAGKLLEHTVLENRQRALVVAPAYLRDGMWTQLSAEWNIQFEVVSYAELRNAAQLGGNNPVLSLKPDEYQLVVIDEAHAFRNPYTHQARALRSLLRGDPPKDLVMLSATPVNNSLWDLYYLLRYFIRNDAAFANEGIPNLKERFQHAQQQDPSDLSPDLLFDVLDQTTVRRTRRFIKEHYPNEKIPDGRGGEIRVTFPDVKPGRIDYQFSETFSEEFFEDVRDGLGGRKTEEDDDPDLTMARYRPHKYLEGEETGAELSLVGLLRTGMLKRFESSSRAFAKTLERMIGQYEAAQGLLEDGLIPTPDAIEEWVEADSDEALDEALDEGDIVPIEAADDADVTQFEEDLANDLEILRRWHDRVDGVRPFDDEKLDALRDQLVEIKERAEEDATNDDAFRRNRKVLIFSYYEDTVDWILDYLHQVVEEDDELACYRGRIAGVAGDGGKNGVSRTQAVQGFAPKSADAPEGAEDKFDILVATDVLGQGVNLQDARQVINYDLPWNPMRVVQRNGRIDRLNSDHQRIWTYSIFPEDQIDDLLELEERIRVKLAWVAKSIGLENEIIPDAETARRNFADTREDIQAIQNEDPDFYEQAGTQAAAFSGEELRQELRHGLRDHEDEVRSLPWGAGSGFRGEEPGWFFCARIGEEPFYRWIPLPTDTDDEAEDQELEVVKDTLTCLQRIECTLETDRDLPDPIREGVYEAWALAREDIYEEWMYRVDPANIEPDIPKACRDARRHLEEYPPPELTDEELQEEIEAVEAPLGQRDAREFRHTLENEEGLSPEDLSRKLVNLIEELGLQPFTPPERYPPIEEDEVKLVCWMGVAPEENDWGSLTPERTLGAFAKNT